ncbi:aminotransferase class V-fold PLP-dependent enzyme [Clostridium botulinum]|uniref:Decarboxylase n=1 Tax=Clostridium botulinum C/D str. DC5 TaxID=1443128 RepID=A0A0A0I8T0_CLOBO|nr:aminotransferase class V-fold PLP-dependent enzyme [Clostridium botulinum]KEI06743.1 decarboxylase [Clostridium botulinum C/D str. BKT75002]KEI10853.1 decarboxylase [Clostridium botulinum C/D str. BKT2873]KGM93516.1 decarboxylase [Clostridium botulinum D str. CCUG 7971]KGM97874.1 decarboxylase [Clostridium botulinum C/D str. DC5]KOC49227.1 decarboxylase [Clostridium botulinum]
MAKLPLVEGILNYCKENNVRFSMPGHKGKKGFESTDIGIKMIKNFIDMDITEVDGVDNFHNANGIIKEAQEALAEFYGSKRAYFLVNGSTSGNLTMIFSVFNEGDKVIVERNCHKSIFNGIILRKLNPIYIKNKIDSNFNAPLSIDEEHFLKLLNDNKDAKGIILTYPNYYGICPNLEFIIKEAKRRDIKVLVDSAHGAHFGICKELPKSAVKLGADMVVMSSHKTLPSLTQTAYLHINNDEYLEKVEFYLHMFLSTSPSYLLMCSMDYARFYLEKDGAKDYKKLINLANQYKEKINTIYGFHVICKDDLEDSIYDMDKTRYVINVGKGYSAEKLLNYLRHNKIQVEMNDSENLVLILGTFNEEEDFEKLYIVLKNCPREILMDEYYDILNYNIPEIKMLPYEVIEKPKELIDITKSEGRICAEAIVPYPPGIPLVTLGEIIDKESIKLVEHYLNSGVEVIGVVKEKEELQVKVLKDNL